MLKTMRAEEVNALSVDDVYHTRFHEPPEAVQFRYSALFAAFQEDHLEIVDLLLSHPTIDPAAFVWRSDLPPGVGVLSRKLQI